MIHLNGEMSQWDEAIKWLCVFEDGATGWLELNLRQDYSSGWKHECFWK